MKIGYFADGPWAHQAFQRIISHSQFEVAFIVPRFDLQDPVLREYAEKHTIDFLPLKNVNSSESLKQIAGYGCELLVSMSFNQILKKPVIDLASKGFINCHAGALPFYRGRNILNWAIINGEKQFGVTVHYVDEGIDTGDIIRQDMVDIHGDDNYGTVLLKAYEQCAESLFASLVEIETGQAGRRKQSDIHPVGFYCPRRREGDENLSWSWDSERLHNFVRGISPPGPGARFLSPQGPMAITESKLIPEAPQYLATEGEVVGRSDEGVVVKTGDSTLLIGKLAPVLDNGELGAELVARFPIGTRLKEVKS